MTNVLDLTCGTKQNLEFWLNGCSDTTCGETGGET